MKTLNLFSVFLTVLIFFNSSAYAFEASPQDAVLLTEIERATFSYFTHNSNKITGLTRDGSRSGSPSSIAATGFALVALAIGADHQWVPEEWARKTIVKTLKTLLVKAEHERGFFYHFLDVQSGRRVWQSEASSIDTALLVAGALLVGQYYPGTDIERMAHDIYKRVDWQWMMNNTDLMCMGWKPETGFLPYYWDSYNEHLLIQALAIGSPTHPVGKEAWNAWQRWEDDYEGHKVIYAHSGSLFTYQYPQAFIDFRNLLDVDINYFENSKSATLANIAYSNNSRDKYHGYNENSWGLSASVGPGGYKAYGSKPGQGIHDGTIAPYAAIGSIVFTPKESIKTILYFYENYKEKLYGHFGFKGAFNLDKNWWADEYLGIDQGVSLLMLENFLNDGIIWKKFMALEAIQKWIKVANLTLTENA